ncbi:MAG: response regulator transcription factor [Sulfuricurvum sp.]|nr:response regulator transcription factor [Sulfuricurvum sp.]
MNLRVLLIDDHAVVRKGLMQIIKDEFIDAEIIEADSAEEALKIIRHGKFNLIISDISMSGRSGIDLVKQLSEEYPTLPVLILSMHQENQYAVRALKAGASGYLTKDSVSYELIKAVKQVLSGRRYISDVVGELLAGNFLNKKTEFQYQLLSDREFEVLKLIGSGKSVSEISNELSLSVNTISTYRLRIMEKMKLQTNADIIRYVIEHELV